MELFCDTDDFCQVSEPLVVDVAFIKGHNAAFQGRKLTPLNHVVFIAVAERHKFWYTVSMVQAHAQLNLGGSRRVFGSWKELDRKINSAGIERVQRIFETEFMFARLLFTAIKQLVKKGLIKFCRLFFVEPG